MTDQGKPSVCPTCGSKKKSDRRYRSSDGRGAWHKPDDACSREPQCLPCGDDWHSSPVPAATTIAGFPLKVDPKMPPDEIELRGTMNRVVVTNVSAPQAESAMPVMFVPITCDNSTVDGHDWGEEGLEDRFAALDFTVQIYSDESYHNGCLKYVPCGMDDDPTCGHRVRSKFPDAKPVKVDGVWMWKVRGLPIFDAEYQGSGTVSPDAANLEANKQPDTTAEKSVEYSPSVPAGKDAAQDWPYKRYCLDKREPSWLKEHHDGAYVLYSAAMAFAASETAALRAERDKWQDAWMRTRQSRDLAVAEVGRLECEIKELREGRQ